MATKIVAEEQNSTANDSQKSWLARGKKVFMETYASFPVVLEQGNGSFVRDVNGKEYLDFCSGIAVNSLGHCNEDFVKAMSKQLATMAHCSNLYLNMPAIELAEKLLADSAFDRAFFCNSGAEAIEGSIKLSRKHAKETKGQYCSKILTMSNSFHGRTYGALSATAQTKYHNGYQPMVPEFETVEFNDFQSLSAWDSQSVAAVIVEPIQGEGGVHPVDLQFIKQVRELCTRENIVLIFDEIQCGVGRTGKFFAYEQLGVAPDIVAMAKGLGGGFPIGAILASEAIAKAFKPGDHGTTFGGNPLACTAALTCVSKIKEPAFLNSVTSHGEKLKTALLNLQKAGTSIKDIRGSGLMLGIEFDQPVKPIIAACMERGLLVVGAGEKVMRLLPPLTVSSQEIEQAVEILGSALAAVTNT